MDKIETSGMFAHHAVETVKASPGFLETQRCHTDYGIRFFDPELRCYRLILGSCGCELSWSCWGTFNTCSSLEGTYHAGNGYEDNPQRPNYCLHCGQAWFQ